MGDAHPTPSNPQPQRSTKTIRGRCFNCSRRFARRFLADPFCSPTCRADFKGELPLTLKPTLAPRVCPVCNQPFPPKALNHRVCSKACRAALRPGRAETAGLSSGVIGSIGELAVCADLCMRGYSVYRAVASNAPCDIIILAAGRAYRVEVTRAARTATGGLVYPAHDPKRYDILALWLTPGEIHYQPELPPLQRATYAQVP